MWRLATQSDLEATLSDMEIEAYRTSFAEEGDPIAIRLNLTAARFRAAIRTGGLSRMSRTQYAIPESCIEVAMDYTAYKILKRLDVAINEDRRKAYEKAEDFLRRLEEGKIEVESDGETDADNVGRHAAQLVSVAPNRITPNGLNGY